MRYYEFDVDGYVIEVGTGKGFKQISEDRYHAVLEAIDGKPEGDYRLKENLEWEEVRADDQE